MSDTTERRFELYRYFPSLPAAIVAIVVFGLLTLGHTWRMMRTKTWFCTPFVIGGLFEFIGYIGRALSSHDKEALGPFIMQSLLILLGPALFAASIYMTLGRIISALDAQHHSLVTVKWQTRLFVLGDVLAFLTQMGGGGIQASGTEAMFKVGEKITVAGLFIQILFFGLFTVTSIIFNIRIRKNPTTQALANSFPWQRLLYMLYTVSLLILVRSIFRVIEYIQGNAGYLLRHEIFLYIFDALLMAVCMVTFLLYHPCRIRRGNNESIRLDSPKERSVEV